MPLRSLVLGLAVLAGLAACSAPLPGPSAAPPPVAAKSIATARPDAGAVEQARNFLAVVTAVEPVAEAECRARNPWANCDFRILVDDRPGMPPNAFQTVDAMGRPVIAFTVALIRELRNADELAFVMSHEAAHHIAGHLDRQRLNATLGAAVFGQLAATVGSGTPEAVRTAREIGAAVGARTYSKEFELEADSLGTVIAARAGFDPLRGAEFFFRIPDPGNRFLGTHPPNAERIAVVRRTAAGLGL
jgi:Zn-dependent protease with chaperone function